MAASKSPYASLVGGNARFAGIDQGIDFTGAGPVYALDAGTITRKVDSGSSWPGTGAVIVEKLTGGPAAGKSVYFAEDLTAAQGIAVGKPVQKGQQIAYATGSGLAPGIEVGWATDAGLPVAPRPAARPANQFTPEGADFLHFAETGQLAAPTIFSNRGLVTPGGSGGSALGGVGTALGDAVGPAASIATNPLAAASLGWDALAGASGSGVAKWLGVPKLPKNAVQRSGEIVAGSVLLLLALGLVGYSAVSRVAAPVQPVAKATRGGVKAARVQTPGNRRARQTAAQSPYKTSRQGGKEPRTRPGFEGVGKAPRKKAAAKRPVRRGEGIPF